jgi:uncharacterized protein YbaR (Trm112 family)
MEKILLQALACPVCKASVMHRQRATGESVEFLECVECHRTYKIEHNIPFMTADVSNP